MKVKQILRTTAITQIDLLLKYAFCLFVGSICFSVAGHAADGFFFGMPFSNWAGWFGGTLVILVGYEWMRGDRPIQSDWAPWVYGLTCLFPLCITALL